MLKSTPHEFLTLLDRLSESERVFSFIKTKVSKLSGFYGFEEIGVSLIENLKTFTPVIKAGLLDDCAPLIVKMRNGSDVIIRLPAALGILRAYDTHKMNNLPHPLKFSFCEETLFVTGGDKIQSRKEIGLVMVGEDGPVGEAEIIQVLWKALEDMGIPMAQMSLSVNATTCQECYSSFRSAFVSYFRSRLLRLCKKCKKDFKKVSTRIFHCKEEKCMQLASHAPQALDFLCDTCKTHLRGLLEFLDEVEIPYSLDPRLFKEGSWFKRIVFEFVYQTQEDPVQEPKPDVPESDSAEAVKDDKKEINIPKIKKIIIGEGGQISRAGELITGKHLDAATGYLFLEELKSILLKKRASVFMFPKPKVFIVQLGELAKKKSFHLIEILRQENISVVEVLGRDSMKSQLRAAERVGAVFSLILGQKEALDKTIIVREIESGAQETIPQEKMIEFLKRKLKK